MKACNQLKGYSDYSKLIKNQKFFRLSRSNTLCAFVFEKFFCEMRKIYKSNEICADV
jgi:hypothetical protein